MGELMDRAKGKIKQAVAKLTGNKKLERQSLRDEFKRRAKSVARDMKTVVKETVAKETVKDGTTALQHD